MNMGEHQYLEEFSEHVEYYTKMKNSRINSFLSSIFYAIFFTFLLFFLLSLLWVEPAFGENPIFIYTANLLLVICPIYIVTKFFFSNSKLVKKAKEALDGNLIQLKHPRMAFLTPNYEQRIFTHLHPDDIEIGEIIHPEYSEKMEIGDLVLLRNATCTNYSSRSETYRWEMPRENYGGSGMGRESDGYGYSSYQDRYYSGTSTRTIHKAELKIPTTKIIFSCSQKMKKGDVLTLIATLKTFDEESKIQHISIKKTLNHQHSESEE